MRAMSARYKLDTERKSPRVRTEKRASETEKDRKRQRIRITREENERQLPQLCYRVNIVVDNLILAWYPYISCRRCSKNRDHASLLQPSGWYAP